LAETAKTADQARAQAVAAAAAAASAQQNAAAAGDETFTAFAKGLSQASPTIRAKIAQQLKDAGIYRGKVSGDFNNRFYDALLIAEKRRDDLSKVIDVPDRFDFIASLAIEGDAGAGDGGDGTYISENISILTKDKARQLIDAVIQDQLGRKANDAEVARYTKLVRKAQKAAPTVTTSVRSGKKTTTTTTGGFDAGQYLIDQVSGTDEAKANKVLGFYETFMRALGAD
jgi:hypothetical protein